MGTSTWNIDWRGNNTTSTDANGTTITYTYDLNGNTTSIGHPDGFTSQRSYDAANRLSTVTDPSGPIEIERDALGRPIWIDHPNGVTSGITYDPEGKPLAIDHRTKLATKPGDGNGKGTGSENSNGNRRGTGLVPGNAYGHCKNNGNGHPNQSKRHCDIPEPQDGRQSILRFDYLYTADDLVSARSTNGPNAGETIYTYDAVDRLTGSDGPLGQQTYGYDAAHNRIRHTASDDLTTAKPNDALEVTYTHDAANQLLAEERTRDQKISVTSRTYDGNGNQLTESTQRFNPEGKPVANPTRTRFGYDKANYLIDQTTGSTSTTWARDGLGRALIETSNDITTQYYHDDQWIIGQLGETNQLFIRDDLQLLLSQTELGTDASEQLLADMLGTVHSVTNANGKLGSTSTYTDFGARVGKQNHASSFGFTGELQNPTDSLVSFQARAYDPGTGRFIHEDRWPPGLEDPRTQHQYLYAFNNPTTYVDYLGYFGCCGVDVKVPNPVAAVKSVGSKVVDGAKKTGEFISEHKGTIAKVAIVGGVVACTIATAGICGGVAATTVAASVASSVAIGGAIRVATGGDLIDPGAILDDVAFGAVAGGALSKVRHLSNAGHFQRVKALKSAINEGTKKLFKPATDFLGKVSRRHQAISQRVMTSRYFGQSSRLFGNSGYRLNGKPGLFNQTGRRLKVGWSAVKDRGRVFRLGIGRNPNNANIARLHLNLFRVPFTVADSFSKLSFKPTTVSRVLRKVFRPYRFPWQ